MRGELGPREAREIERMDGHIRAIQQEGRIAVDCQCPICPGMLRGTSYSLFLICSQDSRHYLSVKEVVQLSLEKCVELIRERARKWKCPSCGVEISTVQDVGKCPSCEQYVKPGAYGKSIS